MGSDLYKVKVLEKQDRTVRLRIEVVHPDSNYLSDNESFALMLLREGATGDLAATAPLAQEVSFDDTLDRGWLELYTRGFIERVESKVESGSAEGQSPADWFKGSLSITVTDPVWIAHLSPGAEFDSRSFDITSNFEDCKPIHPGQVDPNAPTPEAFMAVPGSLWSDSGLPAAVRVAAYSSSGYRAPNLKKGTFSAAELKDLDLQVVMYQGQYDSSLQVGLLSLSGESVRIFNVSDGGHGSSSSSPFEGSIGKAELIPGKRLGTRLKLSRMLGNLQPKLVGATVEGESATFRIAVPPGNTSVADLNDEQLSSLGFQLLVAPLMPKDEFSSQKVLDASPLSWTIEREVLRVFPAEERQVTTWTDGKSVPIGDTLPEISGLASRLARGFIAKTEVVTKPAATSSGGLDTMTEAQQREVLVKPWPELVVKVTPHHAVFLQHLSKPIAEMSLPYFREADAWDGAPAAPATAATGFGKKAAPPAQSSSPSYSSPAASSGGPNKMLKFAGIGCGILVGLFLLCLITSALVGK